MYKDESQIENKKTSGKRKLSANADSAKKSASAAKKRRGDSAEPLAKSNAKDSSAKVIKHPTNIGV